MTTWSGEEEDRIRHDTPEANLTERGRVSRESDGSDRCIPRLAVQS